MTGPEWLITFVIVALLLTGTLWHKMYSKRKAAELGKTEEVKINKNRAAAIIYPLMGLIFIVAMLFNLPEVPPGNEPLVVLMLGFGMAFILYGLYKWDKLSK